MHTNEFYTVAPWATALWKAWAHKKMLFYLCIITQNISGVPNHTALLADLYVQVLLYLGGDL